MGRNGAAARFRELGSELRRCRERAGLSGQVVGERTGWDKSKISRVESGHQQLTDVDVIHYLGACGVYLGTAGEYMDLCRDAHRYRDYWLGPHGAHLEDSLSTLIYHESTATSSTSYEPHWVPGLLQTESYARAMINRTNRRSADNLEFCVGARMERQRILWRPRPARFEFFVHEDGLRLDVGGPEVIHEQMLTLTISSGLPTVVIRIVPSSAGAAGVFGGPFRVLRYAEHQPLVYLDTTVGGLFLEDQEFVATYRELIPTIADLALDEGQSREFIAALAGELDRGSDQRHGHDRVEEEQLQQRRQQ